MPQPTTSVIIATRNRAALLARMLQSLERALGSAGANVEVVIADNGSADGTAALLNTWVRAAPGRTRLCVPQPGKAHALNQALRHAAAPLLAFTDDDVEVRPEWLHEVIRFFAAHPEYMAGMGRVLLPPEVIDPNLRDRIAYYRTIPLFDGGDTVHDDRHLYGANMAIRRTVLDRVGPFNERLGPGASGLHEDGDLAARIIGAGLRIGYMPDAVVYHVVEPERLTCEYFRQLHLRDARSRFAMRPERKWTGSLAHWLGAATVCGLWSVLPNPRQRMRARGRMICHRELLRLQWQARRAGL